MIIKKHPKVFCLVQIKVLCLVGLGLALYQKLAQITSTTPQPLLVFSSIYFVMGFSVYCLQSKVVIYDIDGDQLKETTSFSTNGVVTSVKFSPDNNFIACCTDKKQVKIVLTSDFKVCIYDMSALKNDIEYF